MELPVFQIPNIPGFHLDYIFTKPVLIIVLVIYFVIYSGISIVLFYHWSSYGMKNPGIMFARSLFVFVSIVLFVISTMLVYYI